MNRRLLTLLLTSLLLCKDRFHTKSQESFSTLNLAELRHERLVLTRVIILVEFITVVEVAEVTNLLELLDLLSSTTSVLTQI